MCQVYQIGLSLRRLDVSHDSNPLCRREIGRVVERNFAGTQLANEGFNVSDDVAVRRVGFLPNFQSVVDCLVLRDPIPVDCSYSCQLLGVSLVDPQLVPERRDVRRIIIAAPDVSAA